MSFKPGQIIIHKEANHGATSFYMVMEIGKNHYITSMVFGYTKYKDSLQKIPKSYMDINYKLYEHKAAIHPIVKARLDHEIMRRRNIIHENNTPSDVYGDCSRSSKKKHLLSRKRGLHSGKR